MTKRRAGFFWLATVAGTALLSVFGRRLQRVVAESASTEARAIVIGTVLVAVALLALVWVARTHGRKALLHLLWLAPLLAVIPPLLPIVEERVHFALFGWLGFVTLLRFEPGPGFAVCVAVSALDEGLQGLLPDRVADLRDVGVNTAAAMIGGLIALRSGGTKT